MDLDPVTGSNGLLHGDQPGDDPKSGKAVVVRSARACTVCRNAKMRCIGGDDGHQPCQRCKRQGLECVFEKHRRGRKPGSKLSEASKAARREAKAAKVRDDDSVPPPDEEDPSLSISISSQSHSHRPNHAPMSNSPTSPPNLSPIPATSSVGPTSYPPQPQPAPPPPPPQQQQQQQQPPPPPHHHQHHHQHPLQQQQQQQHHRQQHRQDQQQHQQPHPSQVVLAPSAPAPFYRSPPPRLDTVHVVSPPLPPPLPSAASSSRSHYDSAYPHPPPHTSGSSTSLTDIKPIVHSGGGAESTDDSTPDMEDIYPARVVDRETKRHSFFTTILNPATEIRNERHRRHQDPGTRSTTPPRSITIDLNVQDPLTSGLLDENTATQLLGEVLATLNPFINLFDSRLHTVSYIQNKSPFLLSCLMMAGCKFFKAELYRQCFHIAHNYAYKALIDNWKSVEVIQAFMCLTYWKEPDDSRTWTYIGYACRMAVELGLNRLPKRIDRETDLQHLERRNRERTYLVLFVHDRSLSMQTGRSWMLPECELVRHADTWHEDQPMRREDVVVSSFVMLRRLAAETTDVFSMHKESANELHTDINYELLLRGCNSKLTQWMEHWHAEMKKAGGHPFHFTLMSFFRLHVRLFLNSFPLQPNFAETSHSKTNPSLQGFSICFTSALQTLQIIVKEFAPWGMLRYGQDSVTVMSAYSAVMLLKLLKRTANLPELSENASKSYDLITQAAKAYDEAALLAISSSSAQYHARFLRELLRELASKERSLSQRNDRGEEDRVSTAPSLPSQGPITPSQIHPIPAYAPTIPASAQRSTISHSHSHSHSHSFSHSRPSMVSPSIAPSHPTQPSPPIHPTVHNAYPHHGPAAHSQPHGRPPLDNRWAIYSRSSVEYTPATTMQGGNGTLSTPIPTAQIPAVGCAPSYGMPVNANAMNETDIQYSRQMLSELGFATANLNFTDGTWFAEAIGQPNATML